MFCGNCGKEIKDDPTFCPACGAKIGEASSNATETQINENVISDNHVLKKYGCSSLMRAFYIFGLAMLGGMCGLVGVISLMIISDDYYDSGELTLLCAFVMLAICLLIVGSVQCSAVSQMSLYICTDKLYGTAIKPSWFTTQKFEVSYSDILDVKFRGRALVIETKKATYKCIIEKGHDAKTQIQNQMSTLKNQ